ncbi:hypothetical protein INS49_011105 [Diaporthe citri]|uniref:uncharacterized protein n=1 Tax=Diaporthe citri TaxID=83186 RepID=UPI001C808F93|nr:uncharacterized protein INS49_011105 [Diaporthe citri]KAG6360049.1 hypothetical protein INS49_011105 [Diaporthe citri]
MARDASASCSAVEPCDRRPGLRALFRRHEYEEKNRYFKIESHPTAPANAEWAAGNVKKRKAKKVQAQEKRKRQERLKGCIKRSSLLAHPLVGGRLLREFGVVDPEMPVESWTAGLRQKGEVSFLPGQEQDPGAPSVSCLLVEGGIDRRQLQCSYLPTDTDEMINFGITEMMRYSGLSALRSEDIQGDISSIAYHEASHKMIIASNNLTLLDPTSPSQGRITLFQPLRPGDDFEYGIQQYGGRRPTWLLGDTASYLSYNLQGSHVTMHAVRACPASTSGSGLDALIATSQGIMSIGGSRAGGEVSWVTPKPTGTARPRSGRNHHQDGSVGDVFSVDYHPSNPRVCYAGCRSAKVLRVDIRAPNSSGSGLQSAFRHRSSAAHLRCLDDHRVLVAGPRSTMAIYDTRWTKPSRSTGGGDGSGGNYQRHNSKIPQPVVEFPGYKNEVRVKIGLDVTNDAGGIAGGGRGGGVVAAALGDGTVAVFSLRTGRRLRAGDVDDPRVLRAPGEGGIVKALQFHKLRWEKEASLFVGVGPVVRKFTFGVDDGMDDW